jgi:branched-chain amino acid transport system permease protein
MHVKKVGKNIALLCLLLALPYLITNRYDQHILNMILIYVILGMSLNLVFGYTGLLSLGHAAFYGIGAYVSALATTQLGLPFLVSFFLAGLAGAIFGVLIGFPTLRLAGPYFAMATIGFNKIVEMVLMNWDSVTGGPAGISGIPYPDFFGIYVLESERSYFYLLAVVMLSLFFIYRNLIVSHAGQTIVAMRNDIVAVQAMGVNTPLLRISIFTISTVYAAFAGSLYAHMVNYIAPDAFPVLESITLLILVVIGGPGFLKGPFYGAIVIVLSNEYLQYLERFNMLIYGLALIVLLILLPSGIAGIIESVKSKIFKRKGVLDYIREVGIEEMK